MPIAGRKGWTTGKWVGVALSPFLHNFSSHLLRRSKHPRHPIKMHESTNHAINNHNPTTLFLPQSLHTSLPHSNIHARHARAPKTNRPRTPREQPLRRVFHAPVHFAFRRRVQFRGAQPRRLRPGVSGRVSGAEEIRHRFAEDGLPLRAGADDAEFLGGVDGLQGGSYGGFEDPRDGFDGLVGSMPFGQVLAQEGDERVLAVAADQEGVVGLEEVGFLQVRGAFVRGEKGVGFVVDGGDAGGGGVVFDVDV